MTMTKSRGYNSMVLPPTPIIESGNAIPGVKEQIAALEAATKSTPPPLLLPKTPDLIKSRLAEFKEREENATIKRPYFKSSKEKINKLNAETNSENHLECNLEIQSLKKNLEGMDSLKEKVVSLELALNEQVRKTESMEALLLEMVKEKDSIQLSLDQTEKLRSEMEDEVKAKVTLLKLANAREDFLKQSLEEVRKQVKMMSNQNQNQNIKLSNQNIKLKVDLEQLNRDRDEDLKEVNGCKMRLRLLQDELDSVHNLNSNLEKEVWEGKEDLKNTLKMMKSMEDELQKGYRVEKEMKGRVSVMEEALYELNNNSIEFESEMKALMFALEKEKEKNICVMDELSSLKKKEGELMASFSNERNEFDLVLNEICTKSLILERKCQKYEREITELDKKFSTLQFYLSETQTSLLEEGMFCEYMQQEMDEMKKECVLLRECFQSDIACLHQQIGYYEDEKLREMEAMDEKEKELINERGRNLHLKECLAKAEEALMEEDAFLKHREEELRVSKETSEKLRLLLTTVNKENFELLQEIGDLKSRVSKMEAECQNLALTEKSTQVNAGAFVDSAVVETLTKDLVQDSFDKNGQLWSNMAELLKKALKLNSDDWVEKSTEVKEESTVLSVSKLIPLMNFSNRLPVSFLHEDDDMNNGLCIVKGKTMVGIDEREENERKLAQEWKEIELETFKMHSKMEENGDGDEC